MVVSFNNPDERLSGSANMRKSQFFWVEPVGHVFFSA